MTYPANMREEELKEKVLKRKELSPAKNRISRCNLFGAPVPGETSKLLRQLTEDRTKAFSMRYKVIGEVNRVAKPIENCEPNSHIKTILFKSGDAICNKS